MVQSYPMQCLPLGYFLRAGWQRGRVVVVASLVLLVGFVAINGFQLWPLNNGLFVSEYMTRRYYLVDYRQNPAHQIHFGKVQYRRSRPAGGPAAVATGVCRPLHQRYRPGLHRRACARGQRPGFLPQQRYAVQPYVYSPVKSWCNLWF